MTISHKTAWSLRSLTMFALQNWDSDAHWDAIRELHRRGSPDTLSLARNLTQSRNWRKRALGLYIVSQLFQLTQIGHFRFVKYSLPETQAILLHGLDDPRREVVHAAISGLGHRPLPAALPRLATLAADAQDETRWHVAAALGAYLEDEATQILMALARDTDGAVRDWATFGIGSLREADTPAIRELLWHNLHDEDDRVRSEALMGLAVRKDERIVQVLQDLLNDDCHVFALDAAGLIGHPSLLTKLEALELAATEGGFAESYWYHRLIDAIEACRRA